MKRQHRNETNSDISDSALFRNIYSLPDGFRRPVFVFPLDPDQLRDVQQVIQGIGAVPEFMLFPEAGGHRQEQKFVQVRAGGGQVSGAAGPEVGPPSPKKPESVQTASSSTSFRQVTGSCSSSGQDQEDPCITGW